MLMNLHNFPGRGVAPMALQMRRIFLRGNKYKMCVMNMAYGRKVRFGQQCRQAVIQEQAGMFSPEEDKPEKQLSFAGSVDCSTGYAFSDILDEAVEQVKRLEDEIGEPIVGFYGSDLSVEILDFLRLTVAQKKLSNRIPIVAVERIMAKRFHEKFFGFLMPPQLYHQPSQS